MTTDDTPLPAAGAMVAWTPADGPRRGAPNGTAESGPWPDPAGWSDRHLFTDGACFRDWRDGSDEERLARLFVLFNTMVLRDGLDPRAAHGALMRVAEYRQALPDDHPGARGVWPAP